MNIYAGNLNFQVDEEDLQGIFEEYGSVEEIRLIKDKFSGKSKGFAFVQMPDTAEAERAIDELNGATLENRKMVVNEAREKRNNNQNSRF